jgi:hypothetical protein
MAAPIPDSAVEAAKVLDALAVISHDLACHGRGEAEAKVLSARQVAEVCAAIDSAVQSLRRILEISDQGGHGPLSPSARRSSKA